MVNVYWSSRKVLVYLCQIVMKLEFSRQNFEKCSNVKFSENHYSGRRVVPCGRTDKTDRTNLIVTFRIYADAPNNDLFRYYGTARLIVDL